MMTGQPENALQPPCLREPSVIRSVSFCSMGRPRAIRQPPEISKGTAFGIFRQEFVLCSRNPGLAGMRGRIPDPLRRARSGNWLCFAKSSSVTVVPGTLPTSPDWTSAAKLGLFRTLDAGAEPPVGPGTSTPVRANWLCFAQSILRGLSKPCHPAPISGHPGTIGFVLHSWPPLRPPCPVEIGFVSHG